MEPIGIEMNVIEMQPKKPAEEKRGKPEDYKLISCIGKGSFGTVYLVERYSDKKLFAMKIIEKEVCVDYDNIEDAISEKRIGKEFNHPFLLHTEDSF